MEHVFSTQTQGTCQDQLASSQLCYEAAASVASPATVTHNITTNSKERRTFTDINNFACILFKVFFILSGLSSLPLC